MYAATNSQFLSFAKSFFEMQVDVFNRLNMRHLEGYSNLLDLNIHMMRTSLNDSANKLHAFVSSKNSADFLSLVATKSQPYATQIISYGRDVAGITADMQDELFKATQIELSEARKEMASIVEYVVEHEADSLKSVNGLAKSVSKATETDKTEAVAASPKKKKVPKTMRNAQTHHLSKRKKPTSQPNKRAR